MPIVLADLVAPAQTAVINCEMQRGVIGDLAFSPELPAAANEIGIIDGGRRLVQGARGAGVRVVHATVALRADRAGISVNNRMMASVVKNPNQILEGSPYAEIIPELGPEPEDIVISRIHGLTPFTGTELDSVLRNLGVKTIVPIGVGLNECVTSGIRSFSRPTASRASHASMPSRCCSTPWPGWRRSRLSTPCSRPGLERRLERRPERLVLRALQHDPTTVGIPKTEARGNGGAWIRRPGGDCHRRRGRARA
jgi:nicotinamidase-related amidase